MHIKLAESAAAQKAIGEIRQAQAAVDVRKANGLPYAKQQAELDRLKERAFYKPKMGLIQSLLNAVKGKK